MNLSLLKSGISLSSIIDPIKFLIYKEEPELMKKLNFDNDEAFLEPLLFAYFNGKKENLLPTEMLKEILQGYFVEEAPILIEHSYNKNGVAYVPTQGYFIKGKEKPIEEIAFIENTKIELIKHPVKILQNIFRDFHDNPIPETEIKIDKNLIKKYRHPLTSALEFIKQSSPQHFQLIEACCKKIVMFRTDPINTNSFATINAHGIAFFNVFQEDYDEVFFVDDIAHQTGHIILITLFFERKSIFKIDENQSVGSILDHKLENRSFYILFHALYTYFTTITCLENCLKQNLFNNNQSTEAIARIGFYQRKYFADLEKFERFCKYFNGIENVLEEEGRMLYSMIKEKFFEVDKEWGKMVGSFNYSNQPYNFTLKKFLKINQNKNL